MSTHIKIEDLIKSSSETDMYFWNHPSFEGNPKRILDMQEFSKCIDQPTEGDSEGIKVLHDITHEKFYVKFTHTPEHVFAQKSFRQLYNLFYENIFTKSVPENFLCFNISQVENGTVEIASRNLCTLEEISTSG
ncbi:MAG: hypothetical protein V4629_05805 [Pseudomonadota bacterium]